MIYLGCSDQAIGEKAVCEAGQLMDFELMSPKHRFFFGGTVLEILEDGDV